MHRPLHYFLVVSVCMHLAVLAQWKDEQQISLGYNGGDTGGKSGATLQLALARPATLGKAVKPPPEISLESSTLPAANTLAHPSEKLPTTASANKSDRSPRDHSLRDNGVQHPTSAHLNVMTESMVTPLESKHDSSIGEPATQYDSEQISAAIRRQLAANFIYPRLAQKRGLQGRVMLSVHLEPNGKMSRISVVDTSGHPVLDRSALQSAKRAAYVPDVIEWLAGQHFDTVVPVHYQLIGS